MENENLTMRKHKSKGIRTMSTSLGRLLSLFLISTFLYSCEVETHSNGNIDGNWHLLQVDTLATGGVCNMADNRIFWAFQAGLLQLSDNDRPDTVFIMRFTKDDNKLSVTLPRINDREQGDPIAEITPTLTHLGVNQTGEHYTIQQLNSTRMTLLSDMLRLSFKKN